MRKMCHRILCWLLHAFMMMALTFKYCDAFRGLIPPDPEHAGKCVYRGDTLSVGISPTVAPCQRLTCNQDGSILVEGCGKLRFPNCNRGERLNTDKPYPECCVLRYKCKQNDGTPYYIEHDVSHDAS